MNRVMKSAKQLLNDARKNKVALPAVNISSVEAIRATMLAAAALKAPVIIETSKGEAQHLGPKIVVAVCEELAREHSVDYALHLDRGNDIEFMRECLEAGYNSISADFGVEPSENVKITKQVRELTNKYDAQLEGALEYVPYVGYSAMKEGDLQISDAALVAEFVKATGVDSIVVSIGTQSGKYKVTGELHFDQLRKSGELMPQMPLVLHGGSFLDKSITDMAIKLGVSKINVNSELRIAYTESVKEAIAANPDEYAPYRLLAQVTTQMRTIVEDKIKSYYTNKL